MGGDALVRTANQRERYWSFPSVHYRFSELQAKRGRRFPPYEVPVRHSRPYSFGWITD